jgi:hypothetical protein
MEENNTQLREHLYFSVLEKLYIVLYKSMGSRTIMLHLVQMLMEASLAMCVRKLFAPGSSPVNVLRLLNIAKVQ